MANPKTDRPPVRISALSDTVSDAMACESMAGMRDLILRTANELGFAHFNYGMVTPSINGRSEPVILSGCTPEWIAHYSANGYLAVDPTVSYAMDNCAPRPWSREQFSSAPSLCDEAADAGLRHGVTLPLHGPRGETALLCLCGPDPAAVRPESTVLAAGLLPFFHQKILDLVSASDRNSPLRKTRLTPRETEFLRWMCVGKNNGEIADIMGISYRTASFHAANLAGKLNCSHRNQVVACAVSKRLVRL